MIAATGSPVAAAPRTTGVSRPGPTSVSAIEEAARTGAISETAPADPTAATGRAQAEFSNGRCMTGPRATARVVDAARGSTTATTTRGATRADDNGEGVPGNNRGGRADYLTAAATTTATTRSGAGVVLSNGLIRGQCATTATATTADEQHMDVADTRGRDERIRAGEGEDAVGDPSGHVRRCCHPG